MSLIGQSGRPAGRHVPAARLVPAGSESIFGASIEGGLGGGSIP